MKHIILSFFTFALATGQLAAQPLRAGFGETNITPALDKKAVYLAGFGKNRKATKVHDPLMARAIVIENDRKKVAIVSVDVVGLFNDVVQNVRKQLPGFAYILV